MTTVIMSASQYDANKLKVYDALAEIQKVLKKYNISIYASLNKQNDELLIVDVPGNILGYEIVNGEIRPDSLIELV